MQHETRERVVITVDDEHLSGISSLANSLRAEGLNVENILPETGLITGEVSSSKITGLKSISGVKSVERDEQMRIPEGPNGSQ